MARSSAFLWAMITGCAVLLVAAALLGANVLAAGIDDAVDPVAAGRDGSFAEYVAPPDVCPGADAVGASISAQERTQLCLLNYARQTAGLVPLATSPELMRSARLKAEDIVRCEKFSHEACGYDVRQRFADAGYFTAATTAFGENLALGSGYAGSPRGALLGWLESSEHRANLLRDDWREQGIALVYAAGFRGVGDTRIWVSHFGRRQ